MSVSVIVGQVRSTAVDLLRGSGLSYDEAAEAVRSAVRDAEETEAG
jgi:Arc/MetJ-type ribon-helix-helix transcriptional regulator